MDQRKVACFSPGWIAAYVVVGLLTRMSPCSKSSFTSSSKESCNYADIAAASNGSVHLRFSRLDSSFIVLLC